MLIATLHTAPIGCGALKFHPGEPSEVKRMWVAGSARGLGIARRLLTELETHAAQSNPVVRLETNEALQEAIALYRSAGYQEVDPFNDEPYADHWFEKRVTFSTGGRDRMSGPDRLARASVEAELPGTPHLDQDD